MGSKTATSPDTIDDRGTLISDLLGQRIIAGDSNLATALADRAVVTSYVAGDDLLTEGAESDHMVFVLGGSVDIVIGTNTVATIPGSCLVGEMALFQEKPRRSATVRAAELTVCAEVSAADFKALTKTYPAALERMIDVIKERDPNAKVTFAGAE